MSRPTKFRAWDETLKEWFYIELTDGTLSINVGFHGKDFKPAKLGPWLEFTGLHGKNGKEIWEGDILRTATDKPMVVSWSEKFASFCLNREGWAFTHWFGESCDPSDCEVLGNIHENPEILK